jgi:hypothetical protein
MDITVATRNAASIATVGASQPVAAPSVSGNRQNRDPLVSRVAAEPEAGKRAGAGDNGEVRAGQPGPGAEYTAEEKATLQELRARDREVRAHEMAHLATAGSHSRGGPAYTFETGPDGRRYAVAGEVSIDTSEVAGDPAATLTKAQQVRRAALAPASPSAQDRQIAAQATAMAAQASAELAQERVESAGSTTGPATSNTVERAYAATAEEISSVIELMA